MEPVHAQLRSGFDSDSLRLSLPDGDAEYFKALFLIFLVHLPDVRYLPAARSAPRSPEIHKHISSFADIVRKSHLLVDRLRIHASCISGNRIHGKICELHARLCVELSLCLLFTRCDESVLSDRILNESQNLKHLFRLHRVHCVCNSKKRESIVRICLDGLKTKSSQIGISSLGISLVDSGDLVKILRIAACNILRF